MNMTKSDFAAMWKGRPKDNGVMVRWYAFNFKQEWLGVRPGDTFLVNWIGFI